MIRRSFKKLSNYSCFFWSYVFGDYGICQSPTGFICSRQGRQIVRLRDRKRRPRVGLQAVRQCPQGGSDLASEKQTMIINND